MEYSYLKTLEEGGEGKTLVIRIGAETTEELDAKRALYLADTIINYEPASEEEYNASLVVPEAPEAPVEGDAPVAA